MREKPDIEYTEEQQADIEEKIRLAKEDRDYVNSVDRRYRSMQLQINNESKQDIDGVPLVDKFEVESWQKEWNDFRQRHGLPILDFENMKERAMKRQRA